MSIAHDDPPEEPEPFPEPEAWEPTDAFSYYSGRVPDVEDEPDAPFPDSPYSVPGRAGTPEQMREGMAEAELIERRGWVF